MPIAFHYIPSQFYELDSIYHPLLHDLILLLLLIPLHTFSTRKLNSIDLRSDSDSPLSYTFFLLTILLLSISLSLSPFSTIPAFLSHSIPPIRSAATSVNRK